MKKEKVYLIPKENGAWDVSVKIFQRTARIHGGTEIGNNNETLYLQVWYVKP